MSMVTLGKYTMSVRDTKEARSNKIETSERNEYVQAAINFHPSNGVMRVTVMCTEQMSYYAHTILPLRVIYKRCTRTHTDAHTRTVVLQGIQIYQMPTY